ncbi:tetraspanin-2A-like [Neocloeon triangulifer]|uniref:tetraspanin-2A-like n=1 Tax=Neocloeon triangulifer TaxID=2078957 RepID=UPI00286F62A7|nr:tetraspanin-2A-like [Neocloeon triangulifer]
MAGKGKGRGTGFEKVISGTKYTLFCFTIISFALGIAIIALSLWMLLDNDFQEWVSMLEIPQFFAGIYVLLICGIVVMLVCILGCLGALMEQSGKLKLFAGLQVLCFILAVVGSGTLMAFSTKGSELQPLMRLTLRNLIMDSFNHKSVEKLRIIQETIGCCGADGAQDYISLKKPLPAECRDTVTGNAYFYGCVEEFTFFIEEKAAWLAGISMFLALFKAVNFVMTLILVKAIAREKEELTGYKE